MVLKESHIILRNVRLHAYHGVLEQERMVGNDYELNLRITCSVEKAIRTDDVADTLNYATVYDVVKDEMNTPSHLLETVAARICDCLMTRFDDIQSVRLSLVKLNPPMGADCDGSGVELFMTKE